MDHRVRTKKKIVQMYLYNDRVIFKEGKRENPTRAQPKRIRSINAKDSGRKLLNGCVVVSPSPLECMQE